MKRMAILFACVLLLSGCISNAAVSEQTHPFATTAPPKTIAPSLEPVAAEPTPAPTPASTPDPSEKAVALAADYLEVLTGQDLSELPYTVEFLSWIGDGEWDVSFALPDQPVAANVRFQEDGTLTFYALWTYGETDETLLLPLASMPEALQEADYKEIAAYWYEKLPIREDAPLKRTQLARKDNADQYPHSAYVLNTVKLRFKDGSVLNCQYDQGTRRLVYFCHYTAEVLGR